MAAAHGFNVADFTGLWEEYVSMHGDPLRRQQQQPPPQQQQQQQQQGGMWFSRYPRAIKLSYNASQPVNPLGPAAMWTVLEAAAGSPTPCWLDKPLSELRWLLEGGGDTRGAGGGGGAAEAAAGAAGPSAGGQAPAVALEPGPVARWALRDEAWWQQALEAAGRRGPGEAVEEVRTWLQGWRQANEDLQLPDYTFISDSDSNGDSDSDSDSDGDSDSDSDGDSDGDGDGDSDGDGDGDGDGDADSRAASGCGRNARQDETR